MLIAEEPALLTFAANQGLNPKGRGSYEKKLTAPRAIRIVVALQRNPYAV
jgi:hypothetical protein